MSEPSRFDSLLKGLLDRLSRSNPDAAQLISISLIWRELAPEDSYPISLRRGELRVEVRSYSSYFKLSTSTRELSSELRRRGFKVNRVILSYLPSLPEPDDNRDASLISLLEELYDELIAQGLTEEELLEHKSFMGLVALARAVEGNTCKLCGRPSKYTPCETCAVKIDELKRREVFKLLDAKPWATYDDLSSRALGELGALEDDSPLLLEAMLTLTEEDFQRLRKEYIEGVEHRLKEYARNRASLKDVLPLMVRYLQLLRRSERVNPKELDALAVKFGFIKRARR